MNKTIELKRGDACPNCDGTFERAKVPTDAQRKAAADRDNPTPIPAHYDRASVEVREELGELFRCGRCGYQTRFPLVDTTAAAAAR